jgi:putative CocE/NonD family hydrolase
MGFLLAIGGSYMEHPSDQPRAGFEVSLKKDVMVSLRDGTHLATDIYLPDPSLHQQQNSFATILERTPYNKEAERFIAMAHYFASRGYVVVLQDTRGRYKSEGIFTKYLDDGPDGYDTVEWIAEQSWSNQKIGTCGISYGAHTQAAMACLNPPHLTCMFLDCGGFSNAYQNAVRNGGAFELKQATWAFGQAKMSPEATENPTVKAALDEIEIEKWFQRLPWKRGHSPLQWVPDYENYLFDQWTHADFDDFWKQVGICAELYYDQFSDVPQIHMGGWYDPYNVTTTNNYLGLSPKKTGPVHLLMGPWTHGAHDSSFAGDVDFGQTAVVKTNLAEDYNELRLRWFDHWLKGIDNGVNLSAPVKIFVMGGGDGSKNEEGRMNHGGHWREELEWPLARAQNTKYYFHAGGLLSPEVPHDGTQPSRYLFDPTHPVPTIGGAVTSLAPLTAGGAFHQHEEPRFYGSREPYLPLSTRHDILVFQTPPLTKDTEVTGPIETALWVSSSAPDTDFTAKLIDVHPPSSDYPHGFDMPLTDGIIRGRYRDNWEHPELLEQGQIYQMKIVLPPTSNIFLKGHHVRVDISSSNFPKLDVNPNTGEPLGLNRRTQVAENTVFHNPENPSHIVLPIIPT